MDLQMQQRYKLQVDAYADFQNRINKYNYRFRNVVSYALALYKKHYFTLEGNNWDFDEILETLKAIVTPQERDLMEKIDKIKCLRASQGFFVSSILTFFNKISNDKKAA